MLKANPSPAPFEVLSGHIFRDENHRRRLADEITLFGAGLRCDQGEDRGPVRRRDRHPALAGLKLGIKGQIESKLIQIEAKACLLISNIDVHRVDTEVRAMLIQ